ncbi:MAG: acyl-CoA thioester hydrolase/BAAT C-terminal domain-containing protein [Eubacterium sp.]|nr:acyl-CoA thioester hydrolase/BAAT C-terminal domain-containing protein [Eubacterium sp.]
MEVSKYSYKEYGFEGALYDTGVQNDDRLLIVIQGLKGLELPKKYASLFASKGISTLAMTYYGVPGLPKSMRAIPLETFENAAKYFKDNKRFRRIGIYGNSKGAGVALLAASVVPDISLVIAASTFGHIMQGTGKTSDHPCKAMVSYKGQDFPYVPNDHMFSDFIRRCIKERNIRTLYFFDEWDKKGSAENEIPVERIQGDILFLTSTHDESVPSKRDVELLVSRLKRENFQHKFRHINSEIGSHNLGYFPVNNNMLPREKKYPEECQKARKETLQIILKVLNNWAV